MGGGGGVVGTQPTSATAFIPQTSEISGLAGLDKIAVLFCKY